MKIAIVTHDKENIAEHFAGSSYILVATVGPDGTVAKEIRVKPGHSEFSGVAGHPLTDEKGRHGFGPEAERRHGAMFETFKDCEALIVHKIGTGAFRHFTTAGVKVVATDIEKIDEAVKHYAEGGLKHKEAYLD